MSDSSIEKECYDAVRQTLIDYSASFGLTALNLRDSYTGYHCYRVMWLCGKIFNYYLGEYEDKYPKEFSSLIANYPPPFLIKQRSSKKGFTYYDTPILTLGSKVHDIGKIAWPDPLLSGGARIDSDPTFLMIQKSHPEVAAKIITKTFIDRGIRIGDSHFDWIHLVLYHHWDYNSESISSYPKKLVCYNINSKIQGTPDFLQQKEEIQGMDSNLMRVMLGTLRLTDELDARTSYRSYRTTENPEQFYVYDSWVKKWEEVVCNIEKNEGNRFHPDVLKTFLNNIDMLRDNLFDLKEKNEFEEECLTKCLNYSSGFQCVQQNSLCS